MHCDLTELVVYCERTNEQTKTTLWADAQCDGHRAECTWRPLLYVVDHIASRENNEAKMRNLLEFAGVPQTHQLI